jgi:hypothetical protein
MADQFYLYKNRYLVDVLFEDETDAVIKWIDHKSLPDDLTTYPHVPLSSLTPASEKDLENMLTIEMSDEAFAVLEQKQKELGFICMAHLISHILKEQLAKTD